MCTHEVLLLTRKLFDGPHHAVLVWLVVHLADARLKGDGKRVCIHMSWDVGMQQRTSRQVMLITMDATQLDCAV